MHSKSLYTFYIFNFLNFLNVCFLVSVTDGSKDVRSKVLFNVIDQEGTLGLIDYVIIWLKVGVGLVLILEYRLVILQLVR